MISSGPAFDAPAPPVSGWRRAAADWAAAGPLGGSLRPLFALCYAAAAGSVRAWAFLSRQPVSRLRIHRGYSGRTWTPGVSDIDFAAVWTAPPADEAPALSRWAKGYSRLRRLFPMLGEVTLAAARDWEIQSRRGGFRARRAEVDGEAAAFARAEEAALSYAAMTGAFLGKADGARRTRAVIKGFVDVSRLCAEGPALERPAAARVLAAGPDAAALSRAEAGGEDAAAELCARAAARLEAKARSVVAAAREEPLLPYVAAPSLAAAAGALRAFARLSRVLGTPPRWAVFDSLSGARAASPGLAGEGAAASWTALRALKCEEPALRGSLLAGGEATLALFALSAAGEDPLKALSWRAAAAGSASGSGPFLGGHTIAACGDLASLPRLAGKERLDAALGEHAATTLLHWRGRLAGPDGASAEDRWVRLVGAALSLRAWTERGELLPGFPLEPLALRHAAAHPEDAEWIGRRVVAAARAELSGEDASVLARQFSAIASRL